MSAAPARTVHHATASPASMQRSGLDRFRTYTCARQGCRAWVRVADCDPMPDDWRIERARVPVPGEPAFKGVVYVCPGCAAGHLPVVPTRPAAPVVSTKPTIGAAPAPVRAPSPPTRPQPARRQARVAKPASPSPRKPSAASVRRRARLERLLQNRVPLDDAIAEARVSADELSAWCAASPMWERLFIAPARQLQAIGGGR